MKNLFRYASLLAAAAMLFACEGTVDDGGAVGSGTDKILKITADKTLVQTFGGDYANLTVTLDDEVLTDGVTFYDGSMSVLNIDQFKFSTDKKGEYKIMASYGTYLTKEVLTIMAVDVSVPDTPSDPHKDRTDFKTRVLVTQFTTTGCIPCVTMKKVLHGAFEDESLAEKVVMTACHPGLINSTPDPAYIHTDYDDFADCSGYPFVYCDMYTDFNNKTVESAAAAALIFNQLYDSKKDVAAGIAVNSSVVDGQLVAKVTVKAAESGNYRVGAFLVEDGVYALQSVNEVDKKDQETYSVHDGVIRYTDCGKTKTNFYGHSIGHVEKGKTADYIFVWDLNAIWDDGSQKSATYGKAAWHSLEQAMGKLHLVVYTTTTGTTANGGKKDYVNNAVEAPVNGEKAFEYIALQ